MLGTPIGDGTCAGENAGEGDIVPPANVLRTQIKWVVPQHYSQLDTAGLSATVTDGQNDLALSLE